MKWLLIVVLIIAALAAIVVVTGGLLPREHQATSRIVVARPPEQVWPIVRDFSALATYWPATRRVERLPDRGGVEVWKQTLKDGSDLVLLVTEEAAPRRLVTSIDAVPGAAFGGRWIYELVPDGAATAITVTEDGWIDNRLFRVVSRITGYHGTLDSYLRALGAKLGEPAAPVHVP